MTKKFAKLDENNIVIDIQAVADNEAVTEQNGIDFLRHVVYVPVPVNLTIVLLPSVVTVGLPVTFPV